MKNQVAAAVAAVAAGPAIAINHRVSNCQIGFACVVTGTLTYKVQHTYDNVNDSAITPTWFDHATVVAQTTTKDGSYLFPITAIRVNVTAYTSGGVTLTVVQAGQA